jgi:HPt (histidine-containing phosphotransfer) domain-containing protein
VRVINVYLAESPKLMKKLRLAVEASDGAGIASFAHSLKSSSANVGARALSGYFAEMESLARRADIQQACELFGRVDGEHRKVQNALAAESEQLTASKA